MNLILHLSTDLELKLLECAQQQGKPPESVVLEALEERLSDFQSPSRRNQVQRWREFKAKLESLPAVNTDSDWKRASAYEGRDE